jgi:phosphatidate cytidylyltransferase
MTDEGEDRGSGFDDLFDDLDKFFAPEEQQEGRGRRGQGDARETPAAGAGTETSEPAKETSGPVSETSGSASETSGSAAEGPSPEAPSDDEILSGDWLPDIEGLDLGVTPPAPPSVPPEVAAPAQEPQPALAAEGEAPGGATAEMSQQDWNRLRRVLGDEGGTEQGEGIAPADVGRSMGEDVFPYGEELPGVEGDEVPELTLEDLKKAPAEYRHLPRREEEEQEDDRDAIRSEGAVLGERESVRDDFADVGQRPIVPEPTTGERPQVPGEPWEEPAAAEALDEPAARTGQRWGAPGIAEVEAAADQMAEDFKTELPAEDDLLAGLRHPEPRRTVKVGQPESLMGPTWEEPGSEVITAEPDAPAFAGRNMPMAVLTAAVLGVLALISIAIDKAFFAFVAGAVVLVGQAEVYAAMHRKGYQPATALGLVLGGLLLAAAYLKGEQAMLSLIVLGAVLSFLWYMAAGPKAREGALLNIGATLLGLVYVPLMAGFLLIILAQPVSGRALTLAILGMTFLYDAAALVIGSLWGSRALAPTISPKKSWEGLLAATFVTFIVSIAILPSIDPLNLGRSVGLALVIAVFAPLGDLAESLLKRDLGVKDMGSVLPGHGGIMDRIDSALFVLPAAFYFLRLIFKA